LEDEDIREVAEALKAKSVKFGVQPLETPEAKEKAAPKPPKRKGKEGKEKTRANVEKGHVQAIPETTPIVKRLAPDKFPKTKKQASGAAPFWGGFGENMAAPCDLNILEQSLHQNLFKATHISRVRDDDDRVNMARRNQAIGNRFALPSARKNRHDIERDLNPILPLPQIGRPATDVATEEAETEVEDDEREEENAETEIDMEMDSDPADTGSISTSVWNQDHRAQNREFSYSHWAIQAEKDRQAIGRDAGLDDGWSGGSELPIREFNSLTERLFCYIRLVPQIVGAMPLSTRRRSYLTHVSRAYQLLALALVAAFTVYFGLRAKNETEICPGVFLDSVIAFGAFAGLLACQAHQKSALLVSCEYLLQSYAHRRGFVAHWEKRLWKHIAFGFCAWVVAVLIRLWFPLHEPGDSAIDSWRLQWLLFSAVSLVHVGIASITLQTCSCLSMTIDSFLCSLISQPDFAAAMKEWNLIQALCRTVSRAVERGFLVSQTIALATALLAVTGWRSGNVTIMTALPGGFVASALVHASFVAAAVTDKCGRVSVIANSIACNKDFDEERMYIVHHIQHSQAGLYVYGVRVTLASVMKCVYVALAMAFAFATRSV